MAPGRKRGANNNNNNNKAKTTNELRLGDLVLAKVKGFPAWPAKVSRPEEWDRAPDPKKYFVQFFGTQEIAFVAPADVQAFTSESKTKVLARCRGKTVKYFAQAVKEICEAFEELQQNDFGGPSNNLERAALQLDGSNVEGHEGNGSYVELSWSDCKLDPATSFENCPSAEAKLHPKSEKQEVASGECNQFSNSSEMHKKIVRDGLVAPEDCEASVATPVVHSLVKENAASSENKADTVVCCERIQSSRASSSSPYSGSSDIERDTSHHKGGKKDISTSRGDPTHAAGDKKSANGHKSRESIVGSKRKVEGLAHHIDSAKLSGCVKDRILGKIASGGNDKRMSPGAIKSESNSRGKAMKKLLKDQRHLDGGQNSPNAVVACAKERTDGERSKKMTGRIGQEQLLSVKKAKLVDQKSDAAMETMLKNGRNDLESDICGDEAVIPVAKRRREALEATSDVNISSHDKKGCVPATFKHDMPKKRRAVRLYDDDDEEPKTPVHGGSLPSQKCKSSGLISDSVKKTDEQQEVPDRAGQNLKASSGEEIGFQRDPAKSISEPQQKVDNSIKALVSPSPGELDKQLVKETKTDLISPTKSPQATAVNKLADQQKVNKPPIKGLSTSSHGKAPNVTAKGQNLGSGGSNSSHYLVSSQKGRQPLSAERPKSIAKSTMRLNEAAAALDNYDSTPSGRLEDSKDMSGSLLDSKAVDSATSMKQLIAAAQAKRRQAQLQNVPHGDGTSVLAPMANLQGSSPSPSAGEAFPSGVANVTQLDAVGAHTKGSFTSPSAHLRQFDLQNKHDIGEPEDKGLSSTHQAAGSTLSGGTEAAVARDAFEGMIETLSRTKESIGRATRLAIDCAKYGIASEVVDLLIRKLENESSFHRRVDLFFLVDSITQCSHSQKGIAGASYIPTVQAALPRLLGAAAPAGASARENRRQCLKVLRLWLERKILPEAVLRRYMDDIRGSNDEMTNAFSLRRPSRAERSVDDPIREMEGMLVDEYGSNATFNLPGFLSSHGFVDEEEDEDDLPGTSCKESDALLLEPSGAEGGTVTPNDRRHHILEDVDGELEMEDVSGHLKVGALSPSGLLEKDKQEAHMDAELESWNNLAEPPSLEGSPPLPLEPPPPLPPLPSSPPPPPPPSSSPSPPPPPPPPPPLPSQPPPPSLLPSGPPQSGNPQPLLSPQPSVAPQVLPQPPSILPPAQAPRPPGYSISTMAGNSLQQVPCFLPAGGSGPHDPSGYSTRPLDYRQNDMYAGAHTGPPNQQFQHNQQFQPCQTTFAQRPFAPIPVPQPPSSHFAYKPTVQQQMTYSHPHPQPPLHPRPHPPPPPPSHPYSASQSEGLRRFTDEQWRSASAEFKADNQHNTWVNGGRAPSNTNFVGEACFRPPERPPANNMGYQVSAQNPALGGPSTSGHGINQMLPSRPDMSALNCWRPA